jgi:hypothetical protein
MRRNYLPELYRSSPLGLAIQPDYVIDGKATAGSQPNGFVVCDLPPGHHEVAVANMPFSSNLFGSGSERMTVDLHSGSTTYLSAEPLLGIVTPGKITLKNVAAAQGRADTANLHQINSACGNA